MNNKVKNLPKETSLREVIVKSPCGKVGYWASQWNKGVWLKGKSSRIHPVFVDSLQETLDWEIITDPSLINLD